MWPAGHYLKIYCIRLYVVCIRLVRNWKFMNPFVPYIQNIIHVGLFIIWLHLMCVSELLASRMTPGFHLYVNLEVLYIFRNILTSFCLLVNVKLFYIVYVLVRFNHVSMVIISPSNGLGWSFLVISNRSIISCKPLLHQYT